MTRFALTWILIALPSVAFAQITPTAQIRELSCNAFASDYDGIEVESFSDGVSSPDFNRFDFAIGETATVSSGLGSGTGIQDSQITSSSIIATGSASAISR